MVPAAPADRGSGGVWLSITIPTVPRRDVDYLNRVLDSIADKLSTDPMDPFYGKVRAPPRLLALAPLVCGVPSH